MQGNPIEEAFCSRTGINGPRCYFTIYQRCHVTLVEKLRAVSGGLYVVHIIHYGGTRFHVISLLEKFNISEDEELK